VSEGAGRARGRQRGDAVEISFAAAAVLRLEDTPPPPGA